MGQKGEKMTLPLKVKLHLKDGQKLFFEGGKFSATPIGVFIIEQDKPDITRIFPWGNIREVEIPFSLADKKIIGGTPGTGLVT